MSTTGTVIIEVMPLVPSSVLRVILPNGIRLEVTPGWPLDHLSRVVDLFEVAVILNLDQVRGFVRPGITDMRKQINGLAALVPDGLGHTHWQSLPVRRNGRRGLKALYWDRNGFFLWQNE